MVFGRRWVKERSLKRLEDIAARALAKIQPVCKEMENEYRQMVEEKGYRLHCRPSWYGDSIVTQIRRITSCPDYSEEEVEDLLPDTFNGNYVKKGGEFGIVLEPVVLEPIYISPEIMRRGPGKSA